MVRTCWRIAAVALLVSATAAGAVARVSPVLGHSTAERDAGACVQSMGDVRSSAPASQAHKPDGWAAVVAGAVVVGLIALRRVDAEDFTDD